MIFDFIPSSWYTQRMNPDLINSKYCARPETEARPQSEIVARFQIVPTEVLNKKNAENLRTAMGVHTVTKKLCSQIEEILMKYY